MSKCGMLMAVMAAVAWTQVEAATNEVEMQAATDETVTMEDTNAVPAGAVRPLSQSHFRFFAGGGLMAGDTTYRIGGNIKQPGMSYDVHFPISELEFPLDVAVAEAGAEALIGGRFEIAFSMLINITDDPGEMKDRDWITTSNPSQLDIYSESESDLEATVFDLSFFYKPIVTRHFDIGLGIGVLVQHFEYECRLIRQYSPSGLIGYDYIGDGSIGITYEVDYFIPYGGIELACRPTPAVQLGGRFCVAPFAYAEDEDHHLLRSPVIKAEGEYDEGYAILAEIEGRAHFNDRWFCQAQASFTQIEIDGEQENSELGIWTHTTDAEVESRQALVLAALGFQF